MKIDFGSFICGFVVGGVLMALFFSVLLIIGAVQDAKKKEMRG